MAQNDADVMMEALEPPKKKKYGKTKFDEDMHDRLVKAIDAEMSETYNYSSAELYSQMAEAWKRYYRQPYGNEIDGYSQWVSPMITKHVNQARAFITDQYFRNNAPIIRFRPKGQEDVAAAELADEYINYLFRNKLDGHKIVDDLVFNAALLKIAPVRVTMKEKKNRSEVQFKYDGESNEEFIDTLAHFFAANPELEQRDPDYEKEDMSNGISVCYRWYTDEVVERYPYIDIISPGAFFVSRQAEDEDEARMVAQMSRMSINDLRLMYPEAPKLNGYSKRKEDDFWQQLVSDYMEWYTEIEWLAKWSHDSLGFVTQYTEGNDESAGLGAKMLFVMDAEIKADLDDSGYTQLYHVIKVGDRILYKEEISERSFLWSSFIPTANRWLGLSFVDLIGQEAKEETINTRAFTDSTVQAAHANPIVDPDQVEMEDIENREPDSVIRRKRGAAAKAGVPAVEWTKQPGPDPSVLQAVQSFQTTSTSMTGVGANFQGATQDEVSDMRVSTETAKIIDNNSSLMLNYFARNFANHLCRILTKLLNVAIMGSATPQLLEIKNRWEEVNPMMMKPRSDFIINADIGVNDAQEKSQKANAILGLIQAASGGGGQDPTTGAPIPSIPVQLTPMAAYEAAKTMLAAQGVINADQYLINPEIASEMIQQQGVQQMISQAVQQGVQQGVQQSVQQAMQAPEGQKMMAEVEKITAEAESIRDKTDKDVFDAATKIEAEERRDDMDAWKEAVAMEQNDIDRTRWEEEMELKREEMELQERLAEKATEAKATAVVSP